MSRKTAPSTLMSVHSPHTDDYQETRSINCAKAPVTVLMRPIRQSSAIPLTFYSGSRIPNTSCAGPPTQRGPRLTFCAGHPHGARATPVGILNAALWRACCSVMRLTSTLAAKTTSFPTMSAKSRRVAVQPVFLYSLVTGSTLATSKLRARRCQSPRETSSPRAISLPRV